MFQEAYSHCRWKSVLRQVLESLDVSQYRGQTFDQIFLCIYEICKDVKGVGMLSMYDITSAICRKYNTPIDKVYIIGGGPKRACRILNITVKTRRIGAASLSYVEPTDVIAAFAAKEYNEDSLNCAEHYIDGDYMETYICKWQKHITE